MANIEKIRGAEVLRLIKEIKQCKIKRQQINPRTQRRECAIEFSEITKDQQEQLKALFYEWQRAYLKRRRRFMA